MNKRFANMPLNAFITIVGEVKCRPNNLKNFVSLDEIVFDLDLCFKFNGRFLFGL